MTDKHREALNLRDADLGFHLPKASIFLLNVLWFWDPPSSGQTRKKK